MSWNKTQIKQHESAAKALGEIVKDIVKFIKGDPNITDIEIRQFIRTQYKKYHLKSDKQKSIVAFNKNTSLVHYYALTPQRLKLNALILIDIWARLDKKGAPFADLSWMMYYGKEIDAVVRNYLHQHGHAERFLHGTGHSLGFVSPHGRRVRINRRGKKPIPINIGYTIEPGIYFKGKFGMRSEINFYIDNNFKIIITTKVQKNIIKIYDHTTNLSTGKVKKYLLN